MDICKDYGPPPFFAIILEGLNVPERSDANQKATVDDWLKGVIPDGYSCYEIYTSAGELAQRLMICMLNQVDLDGFKEKVRQEQSPC